MGKKDPRVDAYIAKSADFAKPILNHLRSLVHEACPEVEEDYKWSFPCFMYKGMFCNMAAFKEHCAFGFWKSKLIVDKSGQSLENAMGQFGRITKVSDLPPRKVLVEYVKLAKKLNDDGVKAPTRVKKPPRELVVPDDLAKELETKQGCAGHIRQVQPQQQARIH